MRLVADLLRGAMRADRWRWLLSVAGVVVALLPVVLGRGSLVGSVLGVLVVGGWAWGTVSRPTRGIAVGSVVMVLMVAVFVVSQWPNATISAPPLDWLLGWMLIGAGCVVALIVDRVQHHPGNGPAPGLSGAPAWRWRVAFSVLTAGWLCFGCGVTVVLSEDDRLRFPASADEVLPLPPTLRLVSLDTCADGGSSGNCTAEFVIAGSDAAARATVVSRLIDHLRHRGWPLRYEHGAYRGTRETGGILPWTPHRLWLDADPDPSTDATAVTVYIGNL